MNQINMFKVQRKSQIVNNVSQHNFNKNKQHYQTLKIKKKKHNRIIYQNR